MIAPDVRRPLYALSALLAVLTAAVLFASAMAALGTELRILLTEVGGTGLRALGSMALVACALSLIVVQVWLVSRGVAVSPAVILLTALLPWLAAHIAALVRLLATPQSAAFTSQSTSSLGQAFEVYVMRLTGGVLSATMLAGTAASLSITACLSSGRVHLARGIFLGSVTAAPLFGFVALQSVHHASGTLALWPMSTAAFLVTVGCFAQAALSRGRQRIQKEDLLAFAAVTAAGLAAICSITSCREAVILRALTAAAEAQVNPWPSLSIQQQRAFYVSELTPAGPWLALLPSFLLLTYLGLWRQIWPSGRFRLSAIAAVALVSLLIAEASRSTLASRLEAGETPWLPERRLTDQWAPPQHLQPMKLAATRYNGLIDATLSGQHSVHAPNEPLVELDEQLRLVALLGRLKRPTTAAHRKDGHEISLMLDRGVTATDLRYLLVAARQAEVESLVLQGVRPLPAELRRLRIFLPEIAPVLQTQRWGVRIGTAAQLQAGDQRLQRRISFTNNAAVRLLLAGADQHGRNGYQVIMLDDIGPAYFNPQQTASVVQHGAKVVTVDDPTELKLTSTNTPVAFLRHAIEEHAEALRRCYDVVLPQLDEASVHMRFTLTFNRAGASAAVSGLADQRHLPKFNACIADALTNIHVPPEHVSEMSVVLPIRFTRTDPPTSKP